MGSNGPSRTVAIPMGTNEIYAARVSARTDAELLSVTEMGMKAGRRCYPAQPTMLAGPGRTRCGFAHHELRLHRDLRGIFPVAFDSFQQRFSRNFPHSVQRLAHRRETRHVKCRARNIIEAKHRDVLRRAKA